MDKILEYHYGDHNSEVFTLVHSEHLNKVADYAEDVQEFIKFLERKAGKTYALVNAMSAGEYYGSNRNGDYFPKKALQAYHKTFESNGHVYKHHVNKDPKKALGRIAFSHYNPSMNRVELVLELDNARSAKIVEKLNDGHLPAVSMGCRVPYDECSVCGNRAKTLREYCDHLKGKMNKVLEDGRKVFAINSMPKFFDLSIVTIPADRTAGFLAKLASSEPVISSAQLAEQLDKEGELEANADIKKKIELPLNIDSLSKDPKNLIRDSQAPLDTKTIEKLSEMNLDEVMSTFLGLRIMPSRRDFQKLALYSIGQSKLAEDLDAQDLIFNASDEKVLDFSSIKYDNFNEKIAGLLENSIPYMSLTQPLIVSRVLEKVAGTGWLNEPSAPTGTVDEDDKEALLELLKKHGLIKDESAKDNMGWSKQIESEPSQIKKFLFGHTEDPLLSPHKSPFLPLAGLGAVYTGYAKMMSNQNLSGFFKLVKKYPWLMPLLVGGGTMGSLAYQDLSFNKTAGAFAPSLLLSVPVSFVMAGQAEAEVRRGKAISSTKDFIRKHPFLTALGLSGVATGGAKLLKRAELLSQMDSESLTELYNELINEEH